MHLVLGWLFLVESAGGWLAEESFGSAMEPLALLSWMSLLLRRPPMSGTREPHDSYEIVHCL